MHGGAVLDVGGLAPLSAVDYPGKLAAVVFLQGCPWECTSCRNPGLQARPAQGALCWTRVVDFLEGRRGQLDAVVFSGGEPTLQAALGKSMGQVRRMGYQVGLHTAGIYPSRLAHVLPNLDWVALDLKAPLDDYPRVTQRVIGSEAVLQSLDLLIDSGVPHEVRVRWDAQIFTGEGLLALARLLAQRGVRDFVLQLDGAAAAGGEPPPEVVAALAGIFERFAVRGTEAAACA